MSDLEIFNMAKGNNRKPERPQPQKSSDGHKANGKYLLEQPGLPNANARKWLQRQSKISIRIHQVLQSPRPKTEEKDGQIVFMGYAPNLGDRVKYFEKAIRERTIRHLENQMPAGFDKMDWNDRAVQALVNEFDVLLSELDFLVTAGDPKAAAAIGLLARETTRRAIAISVSHASALKAVAEKSMNWPVLQGRKKYLNQGQEYVENLNVGGALPFSEEMLAMIPRKPHKEVLRRAFELLCRLEDWRTKDIGMIHWTGTNVPQTKAEENANKLPVFSTETWPVWADRAWEILMEENDDHPENNPDLKRMGKHRELHTALTTAPRPKEVFTTPDANIRDGINDRLKRAIKMIATQKQSKPSPASKPNTQAKSS